MALLVFAPLLGAALLCLALSRATPTRWLGLLGAAASLTAMATLLLAPWEALTLPTRIWAALDNQVIELALRFDQTNWPFALLVAGGGTLALFSLAMAIPAGLRGFGGLFAMLLLALGSMLAGIATQATILLAFAWALVGLLGFGALRASGVQLAQELIPASLLAGLLSALVLMGASLIPAPPTGAAGAGVFACWVLAYLAATGGPPFHAAVDETASAPAGLAGALLSLGLPLLGGIAIIRFMAAQPVVPASWRVALALLGLLTLLAGAAGALGERRMRRLLAWQLSAQMGLPLVALGADPAAMARITPALLINAGLTTLVAYLAVAVIEQRAGSDDISEMGAQGRLPLPGMALLIASASAIGLPGTMGFWARAALFESTAGAPAWAIPGLLAGSTLLALALLGPVVVFWRAPRSGTPQPPRSAALAEQLCPIIGALVLLGLGIAPQLGRRITEPTTPAPAAILQIISAGAALLLVCLPWMLLRSARRVPADPDMRSAVMTPEALAATSWPLAWLAAPTQAFEILWSGLVQISQLLRRGLALFEQRYYLAGLMIALVVVILLLL